MPTLGEMFGHVGQTMNEPPLQQISPQIAQLIQKLMAQLDRLPPGAQESMMGALQVSPELFKLMQGHRASEFPKMAQEMTHQASSQVWDDPVGASSKMDMVRQLLDLLKNGVR